MYSRIYPVQPSLMLPEQFPDRATAPGFELKRMCQMTYGGCRLNHQGDQLPQQKKHLEKYRVARNIESVCVDASLPWWYTKRTSVGVTHAVEHCCQHSMSTSIIRSEVTAVHKNFGPQLRVALYRKHVRYRNTPLCQSHSGSTPLCQPEPQSGGNLCFLCFPCQRISYEYIVICFFDSSIFVSLFCTRVCVM